MKGYVEISRHTATQSQFAAQCRAALRSAGGAYTDWADHITDAMKEMNDIAAGKRSGYHNSHKADDERNFDEICAASADSYQIYLKRYDEPCSYNLIIEYADGHGYMYCTDSTATQDTK
jgi:hypothetical protein